MVLVLGVTTVVDVMGAVTAALVDVDMPPDERAVEPPAEIGLVDVTTPPAGAGWLATPSQVDSVGGMDVGDANEVVATLTTIAKCWGRMCELTSRSEVGRFKRKDAATAICPCRGVLGIAADDVAHKRARICAPRLCRRGKAGRIVQE